ncbi:MAG: 50S ribosomal protein L18 [Alphaproteobacteria bacterium CG_4_10_14_0_2_um_filter_63_37]|nr:MAG: 50S ribosomal protein L18 [Proteobacteria bacterium CG1_02_64_396]PJA25568.1 MAG: 50S ribosomal protein L18 [Alphaproteobacteria bacterium CG_4_10_14_0_2_um_filter_63_37]
MAVIRRARYADSRDRRAQRLRRRLRRESTRLRLSIFRSNKHIYAQIIDDTRGVTLAAASTKDKELSLSIGSNVEAAQKVGELVAKRALAAGIAQVVFDRSGYLYHGRVKALADGARSAGLEF